MTPLKIVNILAYCSIFFVGCQAPFQQPTKGSLGYLTLNKNYCAFDETDSIKLGNTTFRLSLPSDKQRVFVENIIEYSGISLSYKLFSANVPNALATKVDGKKYILFNENFLEDADNSSETFWHTGFILAHEIGHQLTDHNFDASDSGERFKQELQADRFAGYIMFRLGAKQEDAEKIMKKSIYNTFGKSRTHPSKDRRYAAIMAGWQKAKIQQYTIPTPPPPIFTEGDRQEILNLFDDGSIDLVDLFKYNQSSSPAYPLDFTPLDSTFFRDRTQSELVSGTILLAYNSEFEKPPLDPFLIRTSLVVKLDTPIDSTTYALDLELFQNPLFNATTVGEGTFYNLNHAIKPGQKIKFKFFNFHDEGMIAKMYISFLDFIPSK